LNLYVTDLNSPANFSLDPNAKFHKNLLIGVDEQTRGRTYGLTHLRRAFRSCITNCKLIPVAIVTLYIQV
jgi:hypothetical protein